MSSVPQCWQAADTPIGIVAGNPQMLGRFMSYGYDWGADASDLRLKTGRAAEWMGLIKAQAVSAGGAAAPTAY